MNKYFIQEILEYFKIPRSTRELRKINYEKETLINNLISIGVLLKKGQYVILNHSIDVLLYDVNINDYRRSCKVSLDLIEIKKQQETKNKILMIIRNRKVSDIEVKDGEQTCKVSSLLYPEDVILYSSISLPYSVINFTFKTEFSKTLYIMNSTSLPYYLPPKLSNDEVFTNKDTVSLNFIQSSTIFIYYKKY